MLTSIVKIRAGGRSPLSSPPVEGKKRLMKRDGSSCSPQRKRSLEEKIIELVSVYVSVEASEKYKPTGEFEKDFSELCSLVGIKSLCVVARPKRPLTPSILPNNASTGSKGKNVHPIQSQQQQVHEPPKAKGEGEAEKELAPTTFTVAKNKYDYFKPRVEIETEEEANRVFVKELYVRGWRMEQKVIDVLTITMPELERLTVVDLWNAGLTDETVVTLSHCLSSAVSLKSLVEPVSLIKGLATKESIVLMDCQYPCPEADFEGFKRIAKHLRRVQNLSLKSCCITDLGAKHVGASLRDNKNLLTLNLGFNKITDEGVTHIARGLRLNRSLLSLNLSSNAISDDGAKHIGEVLSTFCLTHDEVVTRRQLKSTYVNDEGSAISSSHISCQERSPSATRSFNKDEKSKNNKNKDKKSKEGSNNNKLKDNGMKRGPSNADTTKHQKTPKGKASQKQDRNKTPQPEVEDVIEFKNPLLETVREENGELWIAGNNALINLNLARNNINEKGLEHLYEAVKYQCDFFVDANRSVGGGLMRLSLQRNKFSSISETYSKLNELMKTRDPFYKPPTPTTIEENQKEDH